MNRPSAFLFKVSLPEQMVAHISSFSVSSSPDYSVNLDTFDDVKINRSHRHYTYVIAHFQLAHAK
jgi:hypothetical protein